MCIISEPFEKGLGRQYEGSGEPHQLTLAHSLSLLPSRSAQFAQSLRGAMGGMDGGLSPNSLKGTALLVGPCTVRSVVHL